MGSNMQRQAVPLCARRLRSSHRASSRPVARDSGVCVVARRDGTVDQVDAARIVVRADVKESCTTWRARSTSTNLIKYQRSNQNTCINQKPIVSRATG